MRFKEQATQLLRARQLSASFSPMVYRLKHKRYRLPLRQPLHTAHGTLTHREGVVVEVTSAEGTVTYGEAAPLLGFGTETIGEVLVALQSLGSQFEKPAIDSLPLRLASTRFALGSALSTEAPVAFKARANTCLLPAGRESLARLRGALDGGWLAFKWKVGVGDIAEELALFDDVMASVPAHAKLRLDANGSWTTRQAARWLDRCADRPIEFVEQPVSPRDLDGLLGLSQDFPTTLALDESISGPDALKEWIQRDWPGVYVVKPSLGGCPDELMATLTAAKADVVFSTALETPIGMRAALQVALGYPNAKIRALGFGVSPLFEDPNFNIDTQSPLLEPSMIKQDRAAEVWNLI